MIPQNIDRKVILAAIQNIDENGNEFWYARELQKVLDYKKCERSFNVIKNVMIVCKQSGYNVLEQFPRVGKLLKRNRKCQSFVN